MTETVTGAGIVYRFQWDVLESNAYVLLSNDNAIIIDPIDTEEFYSFIKGIQKANILLTHAHYDHISGLNKTRNILAESSVYSSRRCSEHIQDSKFNMSFYANASLIIQGCPGHEDKIQPFCCKPADYVFEQTSVLQFWGHTVELYEMAGHTSDSICVILDGSYLFSGDTLLSNPTVTNLPSGSKKLFFEKDIVLMESWKDRVAMVFPGHGAPGNLDEMIVLNKKTRIENIG